MGNRLPILDHDGHTWIWKTGMGYMPDSTSFEKPRAPRGLRNKKFNGPYEPKLRKKLFLAAGGICCICGKKIKKNEVTIDHVVPRARGGGNIKNSVPSHAECNNRKGDRMPNGCELIWLAVVNSKGIWK